MSPTVVGGIREKRGWLQMTSTSIYFFIPSFSEMKYGQLTSVGKKQSVGVVVRGDQVADTGDGGNFVRSSKSSSFSSSAATGSYIPEELAASLQGHGLVFMRPTWWRLDLPEGQRYMEVGAEELCRTLRRKGKKAEMIVKEPTGGVSHLRDISDLSVLNALYVGGVASGLTLPAMAHAMHNLLSKGYTFRDETQDPHCKPTPDLNRLPPLGALDLYRKYENAIDKPWAYPSFKITVVAPDQKQSWLHLSPSVVDYFHVSGDPASVPYPDLASRLKNLENSGKLAASWGADRTYEELLRYRSNPGFTVHGPNGASVEVKGNTPEALSQAMARLERLEGLVGKPAQGVASREEWAKALSDELIRRVLQAVNKVGEEGVEPREAVAALYSMAGSSYEEDWDNALECWYFLWNSRKMKGRDLVKTAFKLGELRPYLSKGQALLTASAWVEPDKPWPYSVEQVAQDIERLSFITDQDEAVALLNKLYGLPRPQGASKVLFLLLEWRNQFQVRHWQEHGPTSHQVYGVGINSEALSIKASRYLEFMSRCDADWDKVADNLANLLMEHPQRSEWVSLGRAILQAKGVPVDISEEVADALASAVRPLPPDYPYVTQYMQRGLLDSEVPSDRPDRFLEVVTECPTFGSGPEEEKRLKQFLRRILVSPGEAASGLTSPSWEDDERSNPSIRVDKEKHVVYIGKIPVEVRSRR